MRLRQLLSRLNEPLDLASLPDVEVVRVQEDSRQVSPGDMFIARQGEGADGKQFALAATKAGAVAIVSDGAIEDVNLPVVVVRDAASAASILANAAAGDPSQHMKVLGITGTNGKTTSTFILRHILNNAGIKCGLIGTCEIDDGRSVRPAEMTTPGATQLAEILESMRENGCRAVAMETSSHALAQGRVAGVHFAAAGFTNLTGDHLDYHRTMEDYAAAKARLFEQLADTAVAAVNAEDQWSESMLAQCKARIARFSVCADSAPRRGASRGVEPLSARVWRIGMRATRGTEYCASEALVSAQGSRFTLHTPISEAHVNMKLIGRHNIQNALCAASIAGEAFGLSARQIAAALGDAEGAPGRLQRVDAGQPFTVLVDYAHTDDALANVLSALRPITRGRLRVVFGCGGDRDRSKRPRMAAVAEKWADAVYVTSDNPRTEDPATILEQIAVGLRSPPALVEVDRRVAIRRAIGDAGERDVVLIAGKGHENYQILGTTKHPFDDVEEARQALAMLQAA